MAVFNDDEEERVTRVEEMLNRLQRPRREAPRNLEQARVQAEATRGAQAGTRGRAVRKSRVKSRKPTQ